MKNTRVGICFWTALQLLPACSTYDSGLRPVDASDEDGGMSGSGGAGVNDGSAGNGGAAGTSGAAGASGSTGGAGGTSGTGGAAGKGGATGKGGTGGTGNAGTSGAGGSAGAVPDSGPVDASPVDADATAPQDAAPDARDASLDATVDAATPDADADAPEAPCRLAPIVLGGAAGFAVLAGSTVVSTGPTVITGDLGVSPGTAITGFPPGMVSGTIHSADVASALATADLTTAYNDAVGRILCPIGVGYTFTVAGDLGGRTLTPGLFKSLDSLEITSGDLTLDARGDASAVWIFQMATTLMATAGRKVILAGGASAANIFWQVGTSATLATMSSLEGTVMADQSITVATGATVNGRILARIAAVTLDSNVIVRP